MGRTTVPDQRGRRFRRSPARQVPAPNGKPYALNVVDGVVYTATAQGCGGVPNALYSYHLATRKASTFHPAGGGMQGRRGAAISPEGVVYLVTGDAMFSPQTKSGARGVQHGAHVLIAGQFYFLEGTGSRKCTSR